MKTYIEPSISLLGGSNSDIAYFLWLKSRQWIISDGTTKFMTDDSRFYDNGYLSPTWMDSIPDKFYVGDEYVDKFDYRDRILSMDLQYNNFDYYILEINGSCLFRDFLYNINKIAQWAQSNRFLFSILGETAREDEQHYHISAEYKDIPEWEAQFDAYMEAIKLDPIVDHNRLEMPYSISSTFWIGANKKILTAIIDFLYYKAPFFYQIYGKQLESILGIEVHSVENYQVPASLSQYIYKNKIESEGKTEVGDTVIVSSKMALILYSQFIRQMDTTISGLYNLIMHEDGDSFKHKVFKGGTIFDICYVANKDKALQTVRNRLCAFAMSSGNGPESWNYFLKNFIGSEFDHIKLMEMLPCTFKDNNLIHCKFHDDIKFRNEGKEISNCPCPLVSLSLKDAEVKRVRDHNIIGDTFFETTCYLKTNYSNGFYLEDWTSTFELYTNKVITSTIKYEIRNILDYIGLQVKPNQYQDISKDLYPKYQNCTIPTEYHKYGLDGDLTCMAKGFAIQKISEMLVNRGYESFLINFGGDIFGRRTNQVIDVNHGPYKLALDGTFSVFTSGNTDKRGNHIIGAEPGDETVIIVNWKNLHNIDNTIVDIIATKVTAGEVDIVEKCKSKLNILRMTTLKFKKGILQNSVYCASPFFNQEQIDIRDRMISIIPNNFRPDKTESSDKYEFAHKNNLMTEKLLNDVVRDNIKGIKISDLLVFPKYTSDLGTLFEVGVALAIHHPVISFDHITGTYTINCIYSNTNKYSKNSEDYLFDCSVKSQAVMMGLISECVPMDRIFYELKGCPDNIMLSAFYTHVECSEDGEYMLIERDLYEKDK